MDQGEPVCICKKTRGIYRAFVAETRRSWVWTKCIPGEVLNGIYTMDGSLPTYVQESCQRRKVVIKVLISSYFESE